MLKINTDFTFQKSGFEKCSSLEQADKVMVFKVMVSYSKGD